MLSTENKIAFTVKVVVIILCPIHLLAGESTNGAKKTVESVQLKTEHFDKDPQWEGWGNRATPRNPKVVEQNFGYKTTNFAGKEKGEIGGTLWRDSTKAWYADKIPAKTLNERLSASGTFALTETSGSSGAFFGWFKDGSGSGRQNSLGFRLSGQGSGARLTFQLVTATNQACGTKITPWVVDKTKEKGKGRKYRPPSIKSDGTRYAWKMQYDPNAEDGGGHMQFTIRSDSKSPDEFEGKTFTVRLPKGYKEHDTTFDRFGMVNSFRPGNSMTIYFDDLEYDGKRQDFSSDPRWLASGNQAEYQKREEGGVHDFGFSPASNHAGGSPGELGGTIWRSGPYAYYADRVGPLSIDDRLQASGKVYLEVAPPDSGLYLGWFNSAEKELAPPQAGNFIGVKIGGPTRVGHYFAPAYATVPTEKPEPDTRRQHPPNISSERKVGPVLVPQKAYAWKLEYNPDASGGDGQIDVTLGNETATLPLKRGDKAKTQTFDRFGLFTSHRGGSFVRIYFDDLKYTAKSR
jgi:hypothetical protein